MKSSRNNNFITLKWVYKISKKFLPLVVLLCIISIMLSLLFVWLALVSKDVLDIATGNLQGSFWHTGILLLVIVVSQILLSCANSLLKTYIDAKFIISMRNYLFSLLYKKRYSKLVNYHSGDLLNRFVSDVDVVNSAVMNILPSICSMLSKIIGGFSALLFLDARVAVIVVILGIFVPAIGRLISKKYKSMHKYCQESEGKTRSFLQECMENSVIVKTFNGITPFTRRLNQLMNINFKFKIKRALYSLATHTAMQTFFTFGYYLILLWGADKISAGAMTFGTLNAFLQLVGQMRAPLQNVTGIMPQYYSALASAERLMELEAGEEDLPSLENSELERIKNEFFSVNVNDVTFAYDNETILEHCSFTAERGKITAITGESGSGKSTIFKILLGLYEPQSGNITLDNGMELNTSHRGLFAYVPQGNLLLSGTIRENITLYDDTISEEKVIKACKAAEIYNLIESMPEGLDTVLAERGAGLSEGQIQRISLARALLTNAPILLLDEATSALDEATETRVLGNIREFSDKTIIFVTHRNTSLSVCDKIIHVDDKQFNVVKAV